MNFLIKISNTNILEKKYFHYFCTHNLCNRTSFPAQVSSSLQCKTPPSRMTSFTNQDHQTSARGMNHAHHLFDRIPHPVITLKNCRDFQRATDFNRKIYVWHRINEEISMSDLIPTFIIIHEIDRPLLTKITTYKDISKQFVVK